MQYALDDYGVATNSLHAEVVAQSYSGSNGNDSSGGGTTGGTTYFIRTADDCLYKGSSLAFATVTLSPGLTVIADWKGEWSYTAVNAEVHCYVGGNELCIPQNCPAYMGHVTNP